MSIPSISINRAWLYYFPSGWLGGTGIVIAPDVQTALDIANAEIGNSVIRAHSAAGRFARPLTADGLREVDLTKAHAITIDNGDY